MNIGFRLMKDFNRTNYYVGDLAASVPRRSKSGNVTAAQRRIRWQVARDQKYRSQWKMPV